MHVESGAAAETVIKAYSTDIDKLVAQEGYQTVDVVSLNADTQINQC